MGGAAKVWESCPLETTRFLMRRKNPPLKIQMAGDLRGMLGARRQHVGSFQRLGLIGGTLKNNGTFDGTFQNQ